MAEVEARSKSQGQGHIIYDSHSVDAKRLASSRQDRTISVISVAFVLSRQSGLALLAVAMVGSSLTVEHKLAGEPIATSLVIAISIAGSLVGLIIALRKSFQGPSTNRLDHCRAVAPR